MCSVLAHFGNHGARRDSTSQEGGHGDGARFSHADSPSINRQSRLCPTVVGEMVAQCRGQPRRHAFVKAEQAASVHPVAIAAQQV